MKTNKILQKLDYEFSEASNYLLKRKKQLKNISASINAEEKVLRKKLKREGNKRNRKQLKQQLHVVTQAQAMIK